MTASASEKITRDYYNSDDADTFYASIWGGEDIHIGVYEKVDETIFDASRRTVAQLAACVPALGVDAIACWTSAPDTGDRRVIWREPLTVTSPA